MRSSRIEVTFRKFLHNHHLVWMEMKIIMKNSPHRTIRKSKGRCIFARRTPWWSQHWNSHCLNVLRWSNGLRDSSSFSCCTCSLSERSDPFKNWFLVLDTGQRGDSERCAGLESQNICSKSRPQRKTHAPHCPNAWWLLNCVGTSSLVGTKLYSPPSRTRPLALC